MTTVQDKLKVFVDIRCKRIRRWMWLSVRGVLVVLVLWCEVKRSGYRGHDSVEVLVVEEVVDIQMGTCRGT